MPNLDPRRTDPGAKFTYATQDGSPRNLTADDTGAVWPKDEFDEQYLDSLDLPVARKAKAEAAGQEAPADEPVVVPPADHDTSAADPQQEG